MHCHDAQFYLRLRRHGSDELGADVTADLNRHLAGCSACGADARMAASFDRAVAGAIRSVPVPAGLRDKLLAQASAHHGAVIRHKVYRVTALAASLLVGVGLVFGVFSLSRPVIDTTEMVMNADAQIEDREGHILRQWLAAHDLPTTLPEPLDPSLINTMGFEEIGGKRVPVVTFDHPTERGFAKVYFFRTNGTFNLRNLQDAQASHTAAIVHDQRQQHGVIYVILHTGRDLKPFLIAQAAGVAQLNV